MLQLYPLQWLSVPRVCGGDPKTTIITTNNTPVFPVYAGVILLFETSIYDIPCVPRVCGGDPCHS